MKGIWGGGGTGGRQREGRVWEKSAAGRLRFLFFRIIFYVNCFRRTVLYMCKEYIYVNMRHVRAQGVDERMINVYYYYY